MKIKMSRLFSSTVFVSFLGLTLFSCSKRSANETSNGPTDHEKKIVFYRNPMDPKITSPVPMKDSMGMDYVPVFEGENEGSVPVAGQATVKINPERQQLIGVSVATVEPRSLTTPIRASARVASGWEKRNCATGPA